MPRLINTLLIAPGLVQAVAGPYYLAYDCPDSCCDRVRECADLPGTYTHTQTQSDLLACVKAVDPACYINARLGFSVAGFDIYIFRNFIGDGPSSNSLLLGISFEDLFKAYPDFIPDATGTIMMGDIDANCDWLSGCLLYGADNKNVQCLKPDLESEGAQNDILVSVWRDATSTSRKSYKFDSHRLSYDYSHLLIYVDRIPAKENSVGCSPPIGDGSGRDIVVTISGQVKNIKESMLLQTQTRLGQESKYQPGNSI